MRADYFGELEQIFRAGVARVDPAAMMRERLTLDGDTLAVSTEERRIELDVGRFKRIVVLGAGKAAAKMAAGVVELLGVRVSGGLIAVKDEHTEELGPIETVVAGHPVPDDASVDAARRMEALTRGTDERTLFVTVISGGGSALLCYPYDDGVYRLSLSDKQEVTRLLLASGATIQEVNCVRKHLSGIKGGRLAQLLHPATSLNLILSDVVGDDLDSIASGLMVPDTTTFADALAIIDRFGIRDRLPANAAQLLEAGVSGTVRDTPKPDDPVFESVTNVLLGSNAQALEAARAAAERLGYRTIVLSSQITGEAREIARVYLGIGKDIRKRTLLADPPACIIGGGETTVTLRGDGKGGRNQEMALAFLRETEKQPADTERLYFLSAGTDGSDGPTDAAGAFAGAEVLAAARAKKLSAETYLANNDAYHFFDAAGYLLRTGGTNTNVCDIQVLLVP